MYSILLVDDEKIIREGVFELLSMAELDLDLTMAASAVEALSILEQRKIDILVMDIRMPQMSGLELYDVIRVRWPHSKMIFLTGHLEFEYVYKVHAHARYVLKAEEDEKILEAVRETIKEIENDLLLEQAAMDRSRHQQRSNYYERMLLLKELVDGSTGPDPITQKNLDMLDIDIDLRLQSYVVMIRCAAMRQMEFNQQYQAGEKMTLLIEKVFLEMFRGTYFGYNKNLTYLLLQPRWDMPRPERLLEGLCETFQMAVSKNIGVDVAAFVCGIPMTFPQVINAFSGIRDVMLSMSPDEIQVGSLPEGVCGMELSEQIKRDFSRKVQHLENLFDNLDRMEILQLICQFREGVKSVKSMHDLFVMELYFGVSTRILAYVQKTAISREDARQAGIMSLCDLSRYRTWDEAFANLYRIVEWAFSNVDSFIKNKNEDVINQIKLYIDTHLDGDTSLYALSSHVHMCQEHLLRIFKKQEGVTILQYVNDLKLEKAKQMLSETDMQIREIAVKLGFTSAGYFGRFFKSKMGITPNLYREQKNK